VVLRLKRVRNPDMVSLEQLQHFVEDMNKRKVIVLLCGVREGFAQILKNLGSEKWLPPECVFLEDVTVGSSTLKAVRYAYELLGEDMCAACPRRGDRPGDKGEWYYVI
jgi:SulP family sulfate permease